jgi:hypothetical protein
MARIANFKNNMAKGELDPLIHERFDVDLYNQALKTGINAVVIPQGGARKRNGFRSIARHRRMLRRVQLRTVGAFNPNVTVTATNGGTAASAVDQSDATEFRTTGSATAGATFEVIRLQLPADIDLVFVDLTGFSALTAGVDKGLFVQTSADGVAWDDFGQPFNLRTVARTRRFAAGAGGSYVATSFVRVVVKNTTAASAGTIGFKEIALWTEAENVSPIRRLNFTFDVDQTYMMMATSHNIDVFRKGVWQAAIPVPHRADQLGEITQAQSRDALLLFHVDIAPRMIFRQGAHNEWDSYAQTFSNVPALAAGTSFGTAQDEIQIVTIDDIATGDVFSLWIDTVHSIPIAKSGVPATTAANILAALTFVPGVTVAVTTETSTQLVFSLTYAGASGSRVWPAAGLDVQSVSATWSVVTLQDGRAATGAYMSAQTGWCRCGTFKQTRLILGGFKLRPETFIISITGLFFDFSPATAAGADAGMEFTLDSDEVAVITHVFSGRHLQLFTQTSEWFALENTIDATKTFPISNTTRHGSKPGIDILQVDGSGLFVQSGGNVVREAVYSDAEQTYDAPAATLLAAHLVKDIVSIDYRRGTQSTDGSQVYMVNADGTAALMTILRDEKVRAVTPFLTDGAIRAVGVDGDGSVFFSVERSTLNNTDVWFEVMHDDSILDASVAFSSSSLQPVVSNLDLHDGKSVWAVADGQIFGPLTVAGGSVTLPKPAFAGEVGLFFEFVVEPLPPVELSRDNRVLRIAKRVHDVGLSLYETTEIAVAANGGAPVEVPLRRVSSPVLDLPPLANLYTGDARVEGLMGRIEHATAKVMQVRPGRVTIRAIYMEAS